MISVIIPTYNRYSFLDRAAKSVFKQSLRDFELIVVDDGSDDETRKLIESFFDPRFRYFHQENRGVSAARNKGVIESKGDLIAFLDSDDCWKEKKLEKQVKFMESTSCLISHTQELWYRRGKILNQKKKHRKCFGNLFKKSLDMCSISMSTVMIRKSLFNEVGLFDENIPVCEDYDLWLRITSKYPVHLLDEELTVKDGGRPDQLSRKIPMPDRFRIQAIIKLLETGKLNKDQSILAKKELQKKCIIYIDGCRKHGRDEEASKYEKRLKEMLDESV
tara:strand:- start:1716 stop:2543 length:828 start_codon:yes stop_codon:yes gene_type:complete